MAADADVDRCIDRNGVFGLAHRSARHIDRADCEERTDGIHRSSSKGSTTLCTPWVGQENAILIPCPSPASNGSGGQSAPHSRHVR